MSRSTEKQRKDYTVDTLAATGLGDAWLSADGAAIALGMIGPSGAPNRRAFLESVACLPGFPAGLQIGNQTKWRKSAIMAWADERARVSQAA